MNFFESQKPIFNFLSISGFFYYDSKLESNFGTILYNVLVTLLGQSIFIFISFANIKETIAKSFDESLVIFVVNFVIPIVSIVFFILIDLIMILKRADQSKFFIKLFLLESQLKFLKITAELNTFRKKALKQSWINFLMVHLFFALLLISVYFNCDSWWLLLETVSYELHSIYLIFMVEFMAAILECLLNFHSILMKILKNHRIQAGNQKLIRSIQKNLLYLVHNFSVTFRYIFAMNFLCITLTSTLDLYVTLCTVQYLDYNQIWETFHFCLINVCWQLIFYYYLLRFLYVADKLESEVRAS